MKLSILGSTGSIGVQTLDVARAHGYKIEALAAYSDVDGIENLDIYNVVAKKGAYLRKNKI